MTDAVNSSSHKIRLKRNPGFLSSSQSKEAQEFFGEASQGLGSYWESSNARRIASGLTIPEEQLLLEIVLGIPKADREFWQRRDDFYGSLEVKVPYKDGIELEIGLADNTKPVSLDNMPLDIHAYIRYRFAVKHPWTAKSQADGAGNQTKQFYIHDDAEATASNVDLNETRDEALTYFLQIKKDAAKVRMMLTLMGTDYRDVNGQNAKHTDDLRIEKLRELMNANPAKFKELHDDKNFEINYNIRMMLNTQVLKQVGQKILITETGASLGNLEEAVQFFKDESENSDQVAILKAKMQEATKAGKKVKRTFTTK